MARRHCACCEGFTDHIKRSRFLDQRCRPGSVDQALQARAGKTTRQAHERQGPNSFAFAYSEEKKRSGTQKVPTKVERLPKWIRDKCEDRLQRQKKFPLIDAGTQPTTAEERKDAKDNSKSC